MSGSGRRASGCGASKAEKFNHGVHRVTQRNSRRDVPFPLRGHSPMRHFVVRLTRIGRPHRHEPALKIRLDKLLLQRGVVPSRERALALILAGKVLVNGQKLEKGGTTVEEDSEIRLLGEDLKYVSRGGLKLEKALDHWSIDVAGKV